MPKYQRKTIDATNEKIGQDEVVTMPSTGAPQLIHEDIEIPEGPVNKDHLENLKQAEDILTVVLHTTTDKNAEPAPYFWNNNKRYIFPRGFEVKVPRKVVEQLARCKETSYRNEEYTDSDGTHATRWPATTSLRYPFDVREDPNPKCGPAWLRAILNARG